MKLLTKCKGCKQDISVRSSAKTRPDLEYELGEEIAVTCNNCQRKQTKHPNEVRAVENLHSSFIAIIAAIVLCVLLWFFVGAISALAMGIPMYLYVAETRNVLTFNKYRL